METKEKVIEVIARIFSIEMSDIVPETDLKVELGADSLDAVEIAMELEKAFNIMIPDEEIFKDKKTVGDIISYIEGRIA